MPENLEEDVDSDLGLNMKDIFMSSVSKRIKEVQRNN